MNRIPSVFKTVVRKRYFEIFKIFVEDANLILDISNYKNDVIVDRRQRGSGVVAIIESHSIWGEPDEFIKERIKRKFDGLKISVVDENYRKLIEYIAIKMKNNLEEDVIVM